MAKAKVNKSTQNFTELLRRKRLSSKSSKIILDTY
jgi:hypothetical protein